ncbi:MAG: dihydrolipoyllysine-residue succinyltransferase, partial [Proteobacteria bacterium]|nr:dihydrolipoyllysine-residue succinyltransferase [Pseudomonadota bacterium]
MTIDVKVPVLPESVSDATVATWHKKAGDSVRRDENLVDLETDKVVLEVPAPADGVLQSINVEEGDVVEANDVIAVLKEGEVSDEPEPKQAQDKSDDSKTEEKPSSDQSAPANASPAQGEIDTGSAGPAARKMMKDENIDASQVEGSGRGGRITKPDVQNIANTPMEERVPMSRLRAKIADRMVEAQSTAAMLTSFNEVDLKAVMDIRKKYKEEFQKKHGIKLGLMSFFVKAATEALKQFPIINASMEDTDIVYHRQQNIGIAVATDRGLVVPVLKNTDAMGLADIDAGIRDFAEKGNSGKLAMEDLQGGTFTITNGGSFGSLMSTPILNMPQSAILGMHTIKERPVVVEGEIVVRPMMYLALTYDHRII